MSKVFKPKEKYFEIPNERNCYLAGFIAADGNILKNRLSICQSDLKYIKKIKKELDFHGKIGKRLARLATKYSFILQIHSNKIIQDLLVNFNITERKSLTLKPPNILNKKLALCYIAGLIDGDGSIGRFSNGFGYKSTTVYIASTKEICQWFLDTLKSKCKISCRKVKYYANHTIQMKNELFYCKIKGKFAENFIQEIRNIPEINDLLLRRKWYKPFRGYRLRKIEQ